MMEDQPRLDGFSSLVYVLFPITDGLALIDVIIGLWGGLVPILMCLWLALVLYATMDRPHLTVGIKFILGIHSVAFIILNGVENILWIIVLFLPMFTLAALYSRGDPSSEQDGISMASTTELSSGEVEVEETQQGEELSESVSPV